VTDEGRPTSQHASDHPPDESALTGLRPYGRRAVRERAAQAADRLRAHVVALSWAIVALGALLRLGRYLDNRSLWLDEAFLAINLLGRPFGDLFERLDFVQSAPPAFLVVEKAAVAALGDAELSLRAFPFLASLAALVLFRDVAVRLLPPPAALLALLLFATNGVLLYQSAELKPYSSDVAVGLALVALALRAQRADGSVSRVAFAALAVAGPVAVWLSFPAAFVLGGAFVALAVRALELRSRELAAALGVTGAGWLVSFVGMYAVARSNIGQISAEVFAGADSEPATTGVANVVHQAWGSFVNPGGFENGLNGLAALLFVLGVTALARRRTVDRLALLLLPLALNALASLLDLYPLGGRFSIFLVPFLVLLVAAGAAQVVAWSRRPAPVALGIAFFLAMPQLAVAVSDAFDPPAREDVKPLLRAAAAAWQPGDTLFVYRNAQYALRYYTECEDCEPSGQDFPWPARTAPPSPRGEQFAPALESVPPTVVVGSQAPAAHDRPEFELARMPEEGRVWLLFTHVHGHEGVSEEGLLLTLLDERGVRVDEREATGARLYLYRLGRPG
jgi:hypothetical protein